MTLTRLLDYLPRGNLLDDPAWRRRHTLLLWVLGLHVPALFVFALWIAHSPLVIFYGLIPLVACMLIGAWMPQRRMASFFTSAGLVYCSARLVVFSRHSPQAPGATVLTVEDWGVGMRPDDLAQANELLAHPREVDLSVSQRLGLHVVARLATRHGIAVSLSPTPQVAADSRSRS